MPAFSFHCKKTPYGRKGLLTTAHGDIHTPTFMPVGTGATVKAMLPQSVASTGAQIILGNTYHLMLRPGADLIADMGGLHTFMNWPGPILTDSGGFQVMSLAKLRTITEEGVKFRSHIDGSTWLLTPEHAMDIQHKLDATITMAFDECVALPAPRQRIEESLARTHRWEERSLNAFVKREGYGIFAIVQGGTETDLRFQSAQFLKALPFDGYAIGGLAVGEGQEEMFKTLEETTPYLPEDKPRYLMGVGTPEDILGAVKRGVDMFDCVMPTRAGRNGLAFTRAGKINLRNAICRGNKAPLDPNCPCPACQQYSQGYLHHLVKSKEILASMLLSWHNIQYYQDLMAHIRNQLSKGIEPTLP